LNSKKREDRTLASRKLKISEQQINQPRHELLQVADSVAREKGIEREEILEAMEQAIQKTARQKYGVEYDIRVNIDRTNGSIGLYQCETVVEDVQNNMTEISLDHARDLKPDAQIGDIIREPLQAVEFGRVAAQMARQVIVQKVRDAERTRQYEEFKDRVGEIITGAVKRVEFGSVYVDLGRAEGVLRKDDTIPREVFRIGDRIRAFVTELKPESRGPIVQLSRTHPGFMAKLFEQETPEIEEGIIEIKSIARDPGSRAKMAVYTNDVSIDPVGSCVGLRGARVQAIVAELQGEKVDIILWSESVATFVVEALKPAQALKVVIDEDDHRVDVIVDEQQLSLAIGRRGQNVRLASHLTGWNIDIMTAEQEQQRDMKVQTERMKLFVEALDVDEVIAQLLYAEDFVSVEEIAYADLSELASIESFDDDVANEIQTRARNYVDVRRNIIMEKIKNNKIESGLLELFEREDNMLTFNMLENIIDAKIKTLDDLAELSGDELIEIIGDALSIDDANDIIMQARAHWFTEEEA
jgi:N utilization substance protein A